MESTECSWSAHGLHVECSWTAHGLLMDCSYYSWSAHGVLMECSWSPWEGVGECKVLFLAVVGPNSTTAIVAKLILL